LHAKTNLDGYKTLSEKFFLAACLPAGRRMAPQAEKTSQKEF